MQDPTIPATKGSLTIISGGQTGADRAALDFALAYGIPCGGWCPRGRLAEDGPIGEEYPLKQTSSRRYQQRTAWNVRDSDVTVLLTLAPELQGGTGLTARVAEELGKPYLHLCRDGGEPIETLAERLREFLHRHNSQCINIAGPRASQEPEIGPFVHEVLEAALL